MVLVLLIGDLHIPHRTAGNKVEENTVTIIPVMP